MGVQFVPNAVYERTRSALAGLLPRRAATVVLDRALARHRRSPEDVDGEQMAQVLLQGVYRELRGIVPDPGLRRTLRRLARDARARSRPARGATPSEVRAAAGRPVPVPPLPTRPTATSTAAVSPGRPATVDVVGLAAAWAALDGVHGVGLFDGAGRAVEVRGALADPRELGSLVAAGAALLERSEALRSVAIDTPHGRLVAVPVRPQWLALTGAADLNLGAVYAALAALEEER